MVSACVLIRTSRGRYQEVLERLKQFKEVKMAFPVLGRWDVVADVETQNFQSLGRLIMKIGTLGGIVFTETLVELQT
ncbi:Lrp/AsnC ligand binding domain-containing protein [Candidatus Bathyarchaeota archaeon]|nr:Lrp/AsnC ligand binding domain-containing protein [Candidatus Bathyarchaeota archaeon]MBS7627339.1 Lrp/AsnC ligand binding domain-containing protein [Candidatus Bathyarchaeota archaeon]